MDWTKLSSITAAVLAAVLIAVPATIVAPTLSHWYGSFVLGASALVGVFNFCSQYPVGQHNVYACIQFDAGARSRCRPSRG